MISHPDFDEVNAILKNRFSTVNEIYHRAKFEKYNPTAEFVKDEYNLANQLIASHTARRSFATNAYKAKVRPMELMMIIGHTTEKNFLKYIRIEGEENARHLLEHDFYKAKS